MGSVELGAEAEIEVLKAGIKSARWVESKFDELVKEYEGKLIAVEDEEIIASSDSINDLMTQIEKKGKDPRRIYTTSFPPGDSIWIL
jgi:hypothetical protein